MPHPALRARPLGGSLRSGAWLGAALAVALGQPLVAWWWIATRGLPVGSVGEVWGWWLGLMGLLCFAAVSVMLGLVDALTHRLPNVVVAPSAVVLAVLFGLAIFQALLVMSTSIPVLRKIRSNGLDVLDTESKG